jgi:hypothetical protein
MVHPAQAHRPIDIAHTDKTYRVGGEDPKLESCVVQALAEYHACMQIVVIF